MIVAAGTAIDEEAVLTGRASPAACAAACQTILTFWFLISKTESGWPMPESTWSPGNMRTVFGFRKTCRKWAFQMHGFSPAEITSMTHALRPRWSNCARQEGKSMKDHGNSNIFGNGTPGEVSVPWQRI